MIDVYANAHAAIFFASIRVRRGGRTSTFEEIEKVPTRYGGDCLNYKIIPASKRILHLNGVEQEVARLFSRTRPIRLICILRQAC